MRKLKLAMYVSLDGVVEGPSWTAPYWNDELSDLQAEYLYSSDALVLGRVTYETFAASFAGQKGGIADAMNNMPKVVVSKTLAKAEWQNSVLIKGTDELSKLKQQQGRNIGVSGSPTLVRAMIREGLLDQLQLMIFPIVLGSGKRLFAEDGNRVQLELADSRATKTGVLLVRYESVIGGREK